MTESLWDKRARTFAGKPSPTLSISAHDEDYKEYKSFLQRRAIFGLFKLDKSMTVLDAGCGVGRWSFEIAPKVKRLYGTDISGGMIAIANGLRKEKNAANAKFLKAPADKLPFKDGFFDAVLVVTVLQHVPEKRLGRAVAELARVCRKGGRICVLESTREEARSAYLHPRSLQEWELLFKRHGFAMKKWAAIAVVPLDPLFGAAASLKLKVSHGKRKPGARSGVSKLLKRMVLFGSLPFDTHLAKMFGSRSNQKAMLFERA